MGWRRLQATELRQAPLCVWWWTEHHRFGAREAARKHFQVCKSLGHLGAAAVEEAFGKSLRVYAESSSGAPATTLLSMCSAIEQSGRGYAEAVAGLVSADQSLVSWWRANDGGVQQLARWFSTTYVLESFLDDAAICLRSDFDTANLTAFRHPTHAAMAFANYAELAAYGTVDVTQALVFLAVAGESRTHWEALLGKHALSLR